MSDTVIYTLLVLLSMIIIALAFFIVKQLGFLKKKREERLANEEKLEAIQRERNEYMHSSLVIITDALINNQIGVVEGAIRVKGLLDHYDPKLSQEPQYQIFAAVYEQTEHIPIKEAWKKLEKPLRRKHEFFMAKLESEHGENVAAAAASLHSYLNSVRQ